MNIMGNTFAMRLLIGNLHELCNVKHKQYKEIKTFLHQRLSVLHWHIEWKENIYFKAWLPLP